MSQPAPMLLAFELLYESPPQISPDQVREALASSMPQSKLVSAKEDGTIFLIAHENFPIEYKGGEKVPAQSSILRGNPVAPDRLTSALRQSWDWPDAAKVVGRARHQLVLTEMLARTLDAPDRVALLYEVLLQVIKIAPPLAVHCHHAERILDPAKIVRASGSSNPTDRLAAFLNVRLFRIDNGGKGDTLMDTRGLAALGLPDVQIHFRNLDPGRVAACLYNTAVYIFGKGDCIEDGHTIQGLSADQKWKCQHEESIVAPKRLVIDLDPGEPFAAGERNR